jgi:ABC-type transporter Mla subunit MlaD
MAARANYVKIGLFVILGTGAAIALAIALGLLEARREIVSYDTFFGESVQGLEVGAPVKARGVTVGRVGKISFAPDAQMVDVRSDLDISTLKAMGVKAERHPPPNIRAQLASQGLLGGRFLALDVFDPATHPPPELTFAPPERYIPATRSVQKGLEDSATIALERLAQVMDAFVRNDLPGKIDNVVTRADEALLALQDGLNQLDREKLPARATKAIEAARTALESMSSALEGVPGESGLIASAQRTIGSFNEVGRNAGATTRDLGATLNEVRAAAAAIRSLAEQLERNPDMLVKGIGHPRAP